MIIRILKMLTKVTDFVEPWNFARRAPQDGELEESASHHVTVLLSSSDAFVLSISVKTFDIDVTEVKH